MQHVIKVLSIVLSIFFGITAISAQEQTGLRLGNYSGVHGLLLNPASGLAGQLNWSVNLVAGGLFIENNFGYIDKASVSALLKSDYDIAPAESVDPENFNPEASFYADFYRSKRKKSVHLNTFVTGPSVFARVGQHSFGFFVNTRATTSANRIPANLNYYEVYEQPFGEEIALNKIKVGALAWTELGLHYGHQVETGNGKLALAGNLKLIKPLEGAYYENKDDFLVTLVNDDSIQFSGMDMEYAFSNGITYDGTTAKYNGSKGGFGASMDLGAIYEVEMNSGYPLQLGISVVDIGKVKLPGQQHQITALETVGLSLSEYESVTSEDELTALVSNDFLNNIDASQVDNSFSMWLPGGIALSADAGISKHFFVNASLVRRIGTFQPGVERSNIVSLTPRYEMKWVEVALPVTLYNDKDFRFGASLRLGPLTIGSDHLGSWFGPARLSGTDIYMALRVYPFWNKSDGKAKFGSNGKVKCYKW